MRHAASTTRWGVVWLLPIAAWLAGAPVPAAQPEPAASTPPPATPPNRTRDEYEDDFLRLIRRGDLEGAERILRDWTAGERDNFVPWYNLACVLSMRGKLTEAEASLQQAVVQGFSDLRTLTTDPDLRNIRETETYRAIVEGWDRIIESRVDAQLEAAKKIFRGTPAKPYQFEKDAELRLAYISAFDPALFSQAKAEIAQLTEWWRELVLPAEEPWRSGRPDRGDGEAPGGADDPDAPGALPVRNPPWVTIVLPSRPDYLRWATQRYGPGAERVGGAYSHDDKRLVAMDLGSTLRHEYWHALHWRHMDQLGQRHPVWVMEGLCSLVEDIETTPDGGFRPLPSWRTNMAKRLARAGSLMPWDVLFAMDQKRFVASKPLAYYAQARAVFIFLAERGKLRDWYAAYIRGFKDDRTGAAAFEAVFGEPAADTEKAFRDWLKNVPDVVEEIRPGMANLPFDVGRGTGDGVVVNSTPRGKSGRASGLRMRDVITAIDGQSVRDLNDYVRIVGEMTPGDEVRIAYRRGKVHAETTLALIRQPG